MGKLQEAPGSVRFGSVLMSSGSGSAGSGSYLFRFRRFLSLFLALRGHHPLQKKDLTLGICLHQVSSKSDGI